VSISMATRSRGDALSLNNKSCVFVRSRGGARATRAGEDTKLGTAKLESEFDFSWNGFSAALDFFFPPFGVSDRRYRKSTKHAGKFLSHTFCSICECFEFFVIQISGERRCRR
jgi:hypothetical protein